MVQGDSYTYRDFYLERRVKPRKKEELQKKDILKAIDKLYSQRDYWSLEAIRLLTAQLVEEDPEKKDRGYNLYFNVNDMVMATDAQLERMSLFLRAVARHK